MSCSPSPFAAPLTVRRRARQIATPSTWASRIVPRARNVFDLSRMRRLGAAASAPTAPTASKASSHCRPGSRREYSRRRRSTTGYRGVRPTRLDGWAGERDCLRFSRRERSPSTRSARRPGWSRSLFVVASSRWQSHVPDGSIRPVWRLARGAPSTTLLVSSIIGARRPSSTANPCTMALQT